MVDALARAGIAAQRSREPGGSPGAEEIRRLFVEGDPARWDGVSEALLAAAARRSHLVATVWPALEAGRWVVSDRFADSTTAYQGYGRGVPGEELATLHRFIAGDFKPDLTLILDLPVDQGLARAGARAGGETRFERFGRDFHERLRQGFLEIARQEPQRCVILDARADIAAIHQAILGVIREKFGVKL